MRDEKKLLITHHSSLVTHYYLHRDHRPNPPRRRIRIRAKVTAHRRRIIRDQRHGADRARLRTEELQREIDTPYIANTPPKRAPFSFRKRNDPREIVTPFNVPEAVEDAYFRTNTQEPTATIGSFQRKSITPLIEQSM